MAFPEETAANTSIAPVVTDVQEEEDEDENLFSCKHLSSQLDLSVGAPGPDILTRLPALFQQATQHRMAHEAGSGADLFQYGPEAGIVALRRRLAVFLRYRTCDQCLGIRIRRMRMFLGLLDPRTDPLVTSSDPDPSVKKNP